MSCKEKELKLDEEARTRLQRARECAVGGRWHGQDRRIKQREADRIRTWRYSPPEGDAA